MLRALLILDEFDRSPSHSPRPARPIGLAQELERPLRGALAGEAERDIRGHDTHQRHGCARGGPFTNQARAHDMEHGHCKGVGDSVGGAAARRGRSRPTRRPGNVSRSLRSRRSVPPPDIPVRRGAGRGTPAGRRSVVPAWVVDEPPIAVRARLRRVPSAVPRRLGRERPSTSSLRSASRSESSPRLPAAELRGGANNLPMVSSPCTGAVGQFDPSPIPAGPGMPHAVHRRRRGPEHARHARELGPAGPRRPGLEPRRAVRFLYAGSCSSSTSRRGPGRPGARSPAMRVPTTRSTSPARETHHTRRHAPPSPSPE